MWCKEVSNIVILLGHYHYQASFFLQSVNALKDNCILHYKTIILLFHLCNWDIHPSLIEIIVLVKEYEMYDKRDSLVSLSM